MFQYEKKLITTNVSVKLRTNVWNVSKRRKLEQRAENNERLPMGI